MIQVLSNEEFERLLKQRYMQLEKNCKLSPKASYNQYIDWFIKRFDIYYKKYWLAFHLFLNNRGFTYTTCKIRDDIEYTLKKKEEKTFMKFLYWNQQHV